MLDSGLALRLQLPFLTGLFLLWLVVFPVSGDGDAGLHFQSLRAGLRAPGVIVHPWARPLFAILLMPMVPLGLLATRLWVVGLSLITAYQAAFYARDLGTRQWRWLPFLTLLQPFAFLVASDTMTEIPFALATVVLLRLWHARRYAWAAVLCGFTPLLRPEGFLLGLLFGAVMLTRWPTGLTLARRWATAALALLGLGTWAILGAAFHGDLLYFVHKWPWLDMDFGSGSILHYIAALPLIFGLPLFVLWCTGFPCVRQPRMWPSQLLFWLILIAHSVLWACGWMGSAGMLRILACTAPLSALVMAAGLDVAVGRRRVVALGALAAVVWTLGFLALLPQNRASQLVPAPARAMRAHVAAHDAEIPAFISSEPFVWYLADVAPRDPRIVVGPTTRAAQVAQLQALPVGTCGFWDDQRGVAWHKVSCAELEAMGFRILEEVHHTVPTVYFRLERQRACFVVKE